MAYYFGNFSFINNADKEVVLLETLKTIMYFNAWNILAKENIRDKFMFMYIENTLIKHIYCILHKNFGEKPCVWAILEMQYIARSGWESYVSRYINANLPIPSAPLAPLVYPIPSAPHEHLIPHAPSTLPAPSAPSDLPSPSAPPAPSTSPTLLVYPIPYEPSESNDPSPPLEPLTIPIKIVLPEQNIVAIEPPDLIEDENEILRLNYNNETPSTPPPIYNPRIALKPNEEDNPVNY